MRRPDGSHVSLDLLAALDALLDTGSVTRAAKRVNLSQPAMSRVLARLRSDFDDPLLVRVGSRLMLTPRAALLREPVRDVLERADALYSGAGFDPASAERVFHALIPDVIAAVLLPELIDRLSAEAPRCRLMLVPWPGTGAARPDIVITSEVESFPDYRMAPLYRDDDVLAHRSDDRRDEVRLDPLALPHVAVVAGRLAEDPVDRWLNSIGRSRNVATTVPHYLLAMQLVARGRLVAVLPRRMVAKLGSVIGVTASELRLPQEPDQVWLLHPAHHDVDAASRWLRGVVRDIAGD